MDNIFTDEYFMKQALVEANKAFENNEVPVGAVIVANNQVIARAYNSVELLTDITAHAEILAITAASNFLGSKYLNDCSLYVTVEPCAMCAGAIAW
ncbi:MAG: nucleoside deaminase, partial [Bacteroidales bacterium]|nr:nucleoside deaminase [Bacteroidales bacterium]